MGALWSSCTRTVSPFLRTNFVYLMSGIGMLRLLDADCADVFDFAFATVLGWALWLKALALNIDSARNRPAIVCMNLLLKVPPCCYERFGTGGCSQARTMVSIQKGFGPSATGLRSLNRRIRRACNREYIASGDSAHHTSVAACLPRK